MRILLITGDERNSVLFKEQLLPKLSLLLQNKVFSANPNNKLGLLCPGKRNQVRIESSGLIVFELNSALTVNSNIPNFTPRIIRELNGFLNEFQPEIIHCYNEGYIGLIAQFFAVTKKIPIIITLHIKNTKLHQKFATKILKGFFKQTGINNKFIQNYYNRADLIIGNKESIENLKKHKLYKGTGISSETINNSDKLLELYNTQIKKYKREARFKRSFVPISILITGAAIIGSILSFSALKGFSKIKNNLTNHNNKHEPK